MPADAEEIHSLLSELGKPLCGIAVEINRQMFQAVRYLRDRLRDTGLIVHLHYRNEQRVWPDGSRDLIRIDPSARRRPHQGEAEAAPFQFFEWFEDGAVFDRGAHEMHFAGAA